MKEKEKKITITDIAREAGVATATVSRVLNGKSKVKAETREKVLRIIQKHNFKPSSSARYLARNNTPAKVLGVMIPKLQNQFIFEVLNSLYKQIRNMDYNILIFNMEKDRKEILARIPGEQLSGLILFGDPPMDREGKKQIQALNIPYLYFDHHEKGENCISFDNHAGGALAAEYLLNKGRRRVIFFGLTQKSQQQTDRFLGFRQRLEQSGVTEIQEIYVPGDDASYEMTLSLLKNRLCDGIFYFSDQLAYGGMRAKNESHSDISLVGYDDIFPTTYLRISTVRQSADEMASRGLEILDKLIKSPIPNYLTDSQHIILQPRLIDRGS